MHLAVVYRTDVETRAVLRDISVGGFFLEVDAPLDEGAPVEVSVSAPAALEVTLSGRVKHCRSVGPERWGVGVQFDEQPKQVQAAVASLMRQLVGAGE